MLIGANSKLWVALLSIVFLLLNPAGFCAGNMTAQSGGHPCCPKAPAEAKASCLCIDRQTVAPVVPAPLENGLTVAVCIATQLPTVEAPLTAAAQYSPPDRSIAFHQILV